MEMTGSFPSVGDSSRRTLVQGSSNASQNSAGLAVVDLAGHYASVKTDGYGACLGRMALGFRCIVQPIPVFQHPLDIVHHVCVLHNVKGSRTLHYVPFQRAGKVVELGKGAAEPL